MRPRSALVLALTLGTAVPSVVAGAADQGRGPTLKDHWHVAYGVYGCDRYQPPIASGNDPLGIHTHGDGVIHVHPFTEAATGDKAVLGVFLEAIGLRVTRSSIVMPGGTRSWKAGDTCGGKAGAVRVFSYRNPADRPTEVFSDPAKIRLANRQILSFAFVPDGVVPPAPPSATELDDLADVVPPPLTKAELAAVPKIGSKPSLKFPARAATKLTTRDVVVGTGPVAEKLAVPYVRALIGTLSDKRTIQEIGWGSVGPEPLGTLGKDRVLAGLEQGVLGMKVGGRREIVVPPSLAFGAEGRGGIGPNETLVFVVDLAAVRKDGVIQR